MRNQISSSLRLFIVFFLLFSCKEKENAINPSKLEVLAERIMEENDTNLYLNYRNKFTDARNDSLKNALIFDISYYFYKKNDSIKFREWNEYSSINSRVLKNVSGIAEASWDLGNFFFRENVIDSSYYHYNLAYEHYINAKEDLKAGRMLLNMAVLQEKVKDYIGSENTTFRALDLIENYPDNQKYIYSANNNLGIIYNGLGDYHLALEYHAKALNNAESLKNPVKSGQSLNNLGVVHQKLGEHNKSISYYSRALSIDSLYNKNARLYAMLNDNLGYSEFKLGNYQVASYLFQKSLKIRDSIQHGPGIVINKLHLGEYYLESGDLFRASQYAKEANVLARNIGNNRDLLSSYRLLAEIEPQKAPAYLNSYIHLNDSLLQEDRSIQNQFARIRYETDQVIQKANNLNQQKTYLIVGIVLVLLLFFLTYIIQRQKSGNKKLILERKQQDANERIYDLLLRSQQKYEEGSLSERKRISRELHDSILSKFFGIRINLEVLNSKKGDDVEKKRSSYHQSLKDIEKEIREISHKLSTEHEFSEVSFLDILQEMFDEIEKTEGFQIKFQNNSVLNWVNIKNNIKINLFRIIQESLQNIRKHAEADVVEVNLEFNDEYLNVEIKDNGVGFDINKTKKGIGLKNIRDRVKEIQGEFILESTDKGTIIGISIANKYL